MNARFALIGATLLSGALLLAGCGANPTDKLDFKPPAGWTATPSMFGFKLWIKPKGQAAKDSSEIIFLMQLPSKAKIDLNKDFNPKDFDVKNPAGDLGVVEKSSKIAICGSHDARYLESVSTKSGKRADTEMIFTQWGSATYMALYSRSADAPADPVAETAIRSVCQKT